MIIEKMYIKHPNLMIFNKNSEAEIPLFEEFLRIFKKLVHFD